MQKTSKEKLMGIKAYLRQSQGVQKSVEQQRDELAATAKSIPPLPGVSFIKTGLSGMKAEWIIPDGVPENDSRTVLYFHGGGFTTGNCDTHRDLCSRIAISCGAKVLLFEYRLAPENGYPAAAEDCAAAYSCLIGSGTPASSIIFGGESIGGYLVLNELLLLKKEGRLPLPRAAFLFSPHTEFKNFDGESYEKNKAADFINSREGVRRFAADYFGGESSPEVLSPLCGDLRGLPPLFIQAGGEESILSDSTRLYERAKAAGVDARLEICEGMFHIFRFMAYMLPEGQEAINHAGDFIKERFGGL